MLKFSVIIPAHNEQNCIRTCLRSVLTQDEMVNRYEVIVVNNASTDATEDIVKKEFPEVRLVNEPRKGLTIAYNRGAAEARGDILTFVDADMILSRNHLKKIMTEFDNDEKLVALSGPYVYRDGGHLCDFFVRSLYILVAIPAEIILNRLLKVSASIASGNLAVKKETFHKAKGFNEILFYGMESDLANRLRKLGNVRFRYHLATESSARRLKKEGAVVVVAKHILVTISPRLLGGAFTKRTVDIR